MLNIEILCGNVMSCNTYVFFDVENKQALVIDSSGENEKILHLLKKNQISKIILAYTHGHFDHIAHGHSLQKSLKAENIDLKTLAPKLEKVYFTEDQGLEILKISLKSFNLKNSYPEPFLPHIDVYISNNEPIEFLDFILIETPGHSPGSSCFYSPNQGIMFSGDTIFANGGLGRTDLPLSCHKTIWKSLEKLCSYPKNIKIFPGHGQQDILGQSLEKLFPPS